MKRKDMDNLYNNKSKILALMLAFLMIIGTFPFEALAAPISYATGEEIRTNEWSTGRFPMATQYSGLYPNNAGSVGLKYEGTGRDEKGEFINIEVTHVGKVDQEGSKTKEEMQKGQGWSHLVLRFDEVLWDNVNLEISTIQEKIEKVGQQPRWGKLFELKNRLKGNSDTYKTDDYSISIPLTEVFQTTFTAQLGQRALLKLYLKDNHNLSDNNNYLIEHRLMGRTNETYPQIYIRQYLMGVKDNEIRQFREPEYQTYTGSVTIPFRTALEYVRYTGFGRDYMSNVYTDVYIDWSTNELHVNYAYETRISIVNGSKTQFVQLFPAKFKEVLQERNGVVGRYNHVYKRGDLDWGSDRGFYFKKSDFTAEKDQLSGYRLRIPVSGSNYDNYPWTWVTEITNPNGRNLAGNNGRFMAYSATVGPIANHTVYYIDPDKLIDNFPDIDDLKFTSFFVSREGNSVPGVIKNSESIESLGTTKLMTQSPVIDDIYTDSNVITGHTGYDNRNQNVFIVATNNKPTKDTNRDLVNIDGSIEIYPETFGNVFDNMLKDEKISFETIYRHANYLRSRPIDEKVKARIYFEKYENDETKVVDVPSSDKYRGEVGYVENGLGAENMPANPTKEGYIFKGWSTKPTTATAFKDATALTDVAQWNERKAYIFDANTPIDKSYHVYPVWEEENKGIKVILHSNYNDEIHEIAIAYDENIPLKSTIERASELGEQYAIIANGKYSTLSVLPNGYTVEDTSTRAIDPLFGIKKDPNGDKYNLVGWSTMADNKNMLIEDLISNMAIIAKEGTGKDTKYYFTTVRSKTQGIGQAAAAKQLIEIKPDQNNEIHLHAAWKPYFDITLTKSWYDATDASYANKSIKDLLQDIAHGVGADVPNENTALAKPVQVGLLNRTAVTEANDPTVTDKANYYIVNNSLKDLPANGEPLTWHVQSYDMYGKRLSYIAVEFEPGQSGKDKYANFANSWTNIWTKVGDNLTPGSHNWDNKTIAKVQSVVLPDANGEIDAFASATVRQLKENGTSVSEKESNLSKVGTKPSYETKLFNLKTSLNHPTFIKMYDRDKEVKLVKSDDTRVQVVKFDLPEVVEPIIFQKDPNGGTNWRRVKVKDDGWEIYTGDNNYEFYEDSANNQWILKLDLVGKNSYKYLKYKQQVEAQYFGDRIAVQSVPSVADVNERPIVPALDGLEQRRLETIDNEEFVVVRALIPVAELGQFEERATLTLFDANAKAGDELNRAYKNLDGSNVTAKRENGYFVFKVPKSANPNLVHGSDVAVYAEQDGFIPSRSKLPLKLDIKGPEITTHNQQLYISEDVNRLNVIGTDEAASLINVNPQLPGTLKLLKQESTSLGRNWKLNGTAADTASNTTYTVSMEDVYGNYSEGDLNIEIVARPVTDAITSGKQLKNEISGDFTTYRHVVELEGAKVGSTIKVYLKDPASNKTSPVVSVICDNATQKIFLTESVGRSIDNRDKKIYITQTDSENRYVESNAVAVDMDVIGPVLPTIEVLNPGEKNIVLSNIADDIELISLRVGDKTVRLTRDATHRDLWKNDKYENVVETEGKLTIIYENRFSPNAEVVLVGLDYYQNPSSHSDVVADFNTPNSPNVVAENKGDSSTTVSGTSEYPGGKITIYEVTETINEETKEPIKVYTPLDSVIVDTDGNYQRDIKPQKPIGTVIAVAVEVNGKTSPYAETTVVENSSIIPFDPKDPNAPQNPDPERYVTITLDANGGTFAKGTKSSFHVLKDYVVKSSAFEDARLRIDPPINMIFDRWTLNERGTENYPIDGKTFVSNATVYAQYKANDNIIPFDPKDPNKPNNPDPSKYVTVTLDANGGSFKANAKSSYYVKKAYTVTTRDFMDAQSMLIPPNDKAFNNWSLDMEGATEFPQAGMRFAADATVFAQYREGRDVIPSTGNDKPDDYVTVTFTADNTKATLTGEQKYYVNPKAAVKLGGLVAPIIKPSTGYAVSYPAWTYSDNQNAASIIAADVTATASLYDKDKVIPVQDGVNITKPAGYLDIVFNKGEHGKLEGTYKYYVKPGTASTDVPTPTIIPDIGYKVADPSWSVAIPTEYTANFETTANYKALPDISDEPQSGYVMILFEAGEHGKLDEKTNKAIIFVNPTKEIALADKAPTVIADINYSHDGWTIDDHNVDLSVARLYKENTRIKANYTSDISNVSKDDFVLVQFNAGKHGIIASGNANIYVKTNKEVDLTDKAPKIIANEGYTHIGWDKPLKQVFVEKTDITATYGDPNDISDKPVDGFTKVEFVDNTHVTIKEGATKAYWVNPEKVVSVPAPDVVVEQGYMHIGWSESLTQKFISSTTIKPLSMESTDVQTTENPSYTEIIFLTGDDGKIAGTTDTKHSIWVNPEKQVAIQPPQVDAVSGKKLTGWVKVGSNPEEFIEVGQVIKGQFTKANGIVQYQAKYGDVGDISDKPEKGYVSVTFKAGSYAKFKGKDENIREISYYVNPKANKTLGELLVGNFTEPELEYYDGYEQNGTNKWDPDLVKDVIVNSALSYTANVKSKGKVEDGTANPKDWKTVEFRIFDYDTQYAKISGGIKKYKVDPKETVTLTAPKVAILKTGYSLDGWNHRLEDVRFENDTVIYALIGGDISTTPKDGFVKVNFAPGENGSFEQGSTTTIYVRKDTVVDLAPRAPKVNPNENYSHKGWIIGTKEFGTDSIKMSFTDAENTITATYNQDIIDDPMTPNPPAGYARIIFGAGDYGNFETGAKTNFDIRIAAKLKLSDLNIPKVIANEGYYFIKWSEDLDTLITEDMEITAEYSQDIIPGTDPNTPQAPGTVRISFSPGLYGRFVANQPTFYDVRVSANKTLKALSKPVVEEFNGYTHVGWDKADTTPLNANMTVTANYKENIKGGDNIKDPIPEGYVRVEFDPTNKGKITSGTRYQDVLIAANKKLGDLSKPVVEGVDGNVFTGWDKDNSTPLDANIPKRKLLVTAQFSDDIKEVDDPNSQIPEGYARVVFKAGAHGQFKENAVKAYDLLVKEGKSRTLGEVKKPGIVANAGYTFDKWDKTDDTVLVVNQKTEVTALYKQNVIITDDPNAPKKDGYARVSYKTDERGKISANINGSKVDNLNAVYIDVLPNTTTVGELNKLVTLTPIESNVFERWSLPDSYPVVKDVEVKAIYLDGKTATPTIVARNIAENNFTTIEGKTEPNAKVVAKVGGETVGTGVADPNGNYIIKTEKRLAVRTEVSVTAVAAPKSESDANKAFVFDDFDNDGNPDGDTVPPAKPVVDTPRTADTSITMKAPKEDDAAMITIDVKDKNRNPITTVVAEKDTEGWKVNGQIIPVDKETDKMIIPLPPNTELKKDDVVTVITTDTSNNKSAPYEAIVTDKTVLPKPEIDTPMQGDVVVTGKAEDAKKVDVVVVDRNGAKIAEVNDQAVNADGSFTVTVPALVDGEKITVTAKADDRLPSEATKKVGLDLDKIKATAKEADDVIADAERDDNWKPDGPDANPFDKNLKEKLDAAKDAIERSEDADDNNDPTQEAVDKAEEELRDALNKKDADTKVTMVEDIVKEGSKPSAEDINIAQEAIDKIEGSIDPQAPNFDQDKKDLQDRLDLIKVIKEGEERLEEDDIKDKLPQDVKNLEDKVQEGKDAIKEGDKTVYVDKIIKIKEAINIINMERITVNVESIFVGTQMLRIRTSVPRSKLVIIIDGFDITSGKEIIADPYGNYSYALEQPIEEYQSIEIKAIKDGYNDGQYSNVVY
ncbi:MAG: Ig-like domain-containing protein [Firmicutes bacterium]|nr:Ig-like domain-containing protein [Bacillota bacterium]